MKRTFFSLLTLIAATAVAWADQTITLDYSSFGLTTSYSLKTATVDGYSFTVDQGYKGTGISIQMNSTKGSGILYNTTAIPGLKSITVNVASGNKTYTITTGTSEKPSANSQTGSATGTYNAAEGDTFFQLKVSGASYFSSIVITYDPDSGSGTETVATPVISPASCNFSEDFDATITCATDGATILYSLDGSEPSIAYNGSVSIDAGASVTLKAKATKADYNDSAVAEAVYTYVEPAPEGAKYQLVDISEISASDIVVIYDMNSERAMSNNNGTGTAPSAVSVGHNSDGSELVYADVTDNLKWNIVKSGNNYIIYPNGTTDTWLYCAAANNGVRVGVNSDNTFTTDTNSGRVYLKHIGTSRYLGVYNNADWRCYTTMTTTNNKDQDTHFYRYIASAGAQVETPVISPNGGSDLTEAQTVTLSCETDGASIYYTLDGSTPTAESTLYSAPFTVSENTTVKAIGIKEGLTNSSVASVTFSFRVFILGTVNGNSWAPNVGVLMTYDASSSSYTATVTAGAGGASFNMATALCDTWEDINGHNYRWGVQGGGNHNVTVAEYGTDLGAQMCYDPGAWVVPEGEYNITWKFTGEYEATLMIEKDSPVTEGLTKVWEQRFSTPAYIDARFATGFGTNIYALDKSTGNILKYTKDGVSTFATVEGAGIAITSDDAGNILVNKSSPDAASFGTWVIIEPNGTQHNLAITAPLGMEAARTDQVGRVVGNVMSEEGAWMYLAPNGATNVAAIKIVNGAQDTSASAASPTVLVAMNTSTLAQPMFETVDETEAFVDPSAAFYSRNRGTNSLFSWMEDGSEQYALDASFGAGGNEGFDVFNYGNDLYGVVSLARTSEFTLRNVTKGEQVASGGKADESVSHQFRAYTVRKEANGQYGIYVWNAGFSAQYYTFGPVSVESVGSDAAEVSATYYNLQGVRIDNPSAGQIYIRVATLSDGTVRTSKVVVK